MVHRTSYCKSNVITLFLLSRTPLLCMAVQKSRGTQTNTHTNKHTNTQLNLARTLTTVSWGRIAHNSSWGSSKNYFSVCVCCLPSAVSCLPSAVCCVFGRPLIPTDPPHWLVSTPCRAYWIFLLLLATIPSILCWGAHSQGHLSPSTNS